MTNSNTEYDRRIKELPFEEYNQREAQFVVRGLQLLNRPVPELRFP